MGGLVTANFQTAALCGDSITGSMGVNHIFTKGERVGLSTHSSPVFGLINSFNPRCKRR